MKKGREKQIMAERGGAGRSTDLLATRVAPLALLDGCQLIGGVGAEANQLGRDVLMRDVACSGDRVMHADPNLNFFTLAK